MVPLWVGSKPPLARRNRRKRVSRLEQKEEATCELREGYDAFLFDKRSCPSRRSPTHRSSELLSLILGQGKRICEKGGKK